VSRWGILRGRKGRLAGRDRLRRGCDHSAKGLTSKPVASVHSPATTKAPARGGAELAITLGWGLLTRGLRAAGKPATSTPIRAVGCTARDREWSPSHPMPPVAAQLRPHIRRPARVRPRSPDCREARAVQQPNHRLAQPRRRTLALGQERRVAMSPFARDSSSSPEPRRRTHVLEPPLCWEPQLWASICCADVFRGGQASVYAPLC
jgi:hypothetical protein